MKRKLARAAVVSSLLLVGCGTPANNQPAAVGQNAPNATAPNAYALRAVSVSAVAATSESGNNVQTAINANASVGANLPVDASASASTTASATAGTGAATVNTSDATNVQANITTATSSSDRDDRWFSIAHLTDGNLHSSWAPAANDATPTVTFNLATSCSLQALGIKMDGAGVLFDVDVCGQDGTWTTVGTDMTSHQTVLDTVSLPKPTDKCKQVRLRFHGGDVSKLLVCEVQFYTAAQSPAPSPSASSSWSPSASPSATSSAAPSASPSATSSWAPSSAPSATPSTMPSWAPSAMPSTQPSSSGGGGGGVTVSGGSPSPLPTPTPDCCKVTGGGWVGLGNGHGKNKVSFGFVAMGDGASVKGNIEVNDHVTKAKYHGRVTAISCSGHSATFSGTLDAGGTFTATVVDNGEPGVNDTIAFSTSAGFQISETLGGGNIQFHESDCAGGGDDEQTLCDDLDAIGINCQASTSGDVDIDMTNYDAACDRGDFDHPSHGNGNDNDNSQGNENGHGHD